MGSRRGISRDGQMRTDVACGRGGRAHTWLTGRDLKWLKSTLRERQFAGGFVRHVLRESFGAGYGRKVWKERVSLAGLRESLVLNEPSCKPYFFFLQRWG